MPSTTVKGYPYPVGTDRVMDGDDSIRALAEAVDTKTGVAAAGTVVIPVSASGTVMSSAVTFPVGRFTATPHVVVGFAAAATLSNFAPPGMSGQSAAGMTLNVIRTAGSTGNVTVCWHAVQID